VSDRKRRLIGAFPFLTPKKKHLHIHGRLLPLLAVWGRSSSPSSIVTPAAASFSMGSLLMPALNTAPSALSVASSVLSSIYLPAPPLPPHLPPLPPRHGTHRTARIAR